MIPRHVKSLSELVLWLAETHHGGTLYHIAKRVKVSPGLVTQWKDETIKRPSDASLERLCAAYGLDFWEVMALTRRRGPIKIRRPIPIAGGSSNDGTPDVVDMIDALRLIGRWLRAGLYRWGLSSIRTPRLACA